MTSVTLPSLIRGDTWDGISSISITVDGSPPIYPVASARIHFRRKPAANIIGHSLDSEDDSILILDAAGWSFQAPPQALPLGTGLWYWDFETVDTEGTIKTYVFGTITIIQDVTR